MKVSLLSRSDDGHMTRTDLMGGSQLLLQMNKKEYPVTMVSSSALLKQKYRLTVSTTRVLRCINVACYDLSFTFSRDEEVERAKATSDSD